MTRSERPSPRHTHRRWGSTASKRGSDLQRGDAVADSTHRAGPTYETLWKHVQDLGPDTGVQPTQKYVSFTRGGKKFAIVAPTGDRLDLGLKLDPTLAHPALEPAGSWSSMVTHRARVHVPEELTVELVKLLDLAYDKAGA